VTVLLLVLLQVPEGSVSKDGARYFWFLIKAAPLAILGNWLGGSAGALFGYVLSAILATIDARAVFQRQTGKPKDTSISDTLSEARKRRARWWHIT
jgi:hypothetical protein